MTVVRSLLVCAAVLASLAAAQAPAAWAQAWLDAVATHGPGEDDAAVRRIATWRAAQLDAIISSLPKPRVGLRAAADRRRIVERAIVLHADIAILNRTANGYHLPDSAGAMTLFKDGQVVGQSTLTYHWEFARKLLETLDGADRTPIGRPFYRATAAVLQLWGEHPELTRHLAAARRLLGGDDPVLLLYEGTQRQVLAGARTQRFFEDLRRAQGTTMISTAGAKPDRLLIDSMPSLPAALPTAGTSLAQAEGLFRRALSLDPSLAEARIRLAHVLGDRGRHDDAVAELDKLERTTSNLSPRLRYYAALMRGREARATGRLDAAGAAFQEALVVYPRASAARLGLSEIAMAEGDRSGSLAALTDGAAGARSELNEPWWGLERRHDPSAETLVADLRRSVPR